MCNALNLFVRLGLCRKAAVRLIIPFAVLPFVVLGQAREPWLSNATQHIKFGTATKSTRNAVGCHFHEHRPAGSKPSARQMVNGSLVVYGDGTCSAEWLEVETDTPVTPQYGDGDGYTVEKRTITEPGTARSGTVSPDGNHSAEHSVTVWYNDPIPFHPLMVNSVQDIVWFVWTDDGHLFPSTALEITHWLTQTGGRKLMTHSRRPTITPAHIIRQPQPLPSLIRFFVL